MTTNDTPKSPLTVAQLQRTTPEYAMWYATLPNGRFVRLIMAGKIFQVERGWLYEGKPNSMRGVKVHSGLTETTANELLAKIETLEPDGLL